MKNPFSPAALVRRRMIEEAMMASLSRARAMTSARMGSEPRSNP
jgi:hypothetical protein